MLGKVLGGGLPLAAVAASRALMEQLAPVGETYQAGTLSGNPLATAAGLATLGAARRRRLRAARARRPSGSPAGCASGPPRPASRCRCRRVCGLLTVFFSRAARSRTTRTRRPPTTRPTRASSTRCSRAASTCRRRAFEAWFPSLAHNDEQVDAHDRGGGRVVRRLRGMSGDGVVERPARRVIAAEGAAARRRAGERRAERPVFGPLVGGRRARPRRRGRVRAAGRERSSRATCCTTAAARLLDTADEDLRLLGGDFLYALGLARAGAARRPRGDRGPRRT